MGIQISELIYHLIPSIHPNLTKKGPHNAGFNGQQCDEFDVHNYNPNQAHNGCPNLIHENSNAAGPTSTASRGPLQN